MKEIINYRFYRKTAVKLNKSGVLIKHGLRLDNLKRIYFVQNLQPEVLLYGETEQGGIEAFEKQFIAESLRVHNEMFITSGLIEIVKTHFRRIKTPDYYAYLIWINFRFKFLKFWNLIYIIFYSVLITLIVKYILNHFSSIQSAYYQLVDWIKSIS